MAAERSVSETDSSGSKGHTVLFRQRARALSWQGTHRPGTHHPCCEFLEAGPVALLRSNSWRGRNEMIAKLLSNADT